MLQNAIYDTQNDELRSKIMEKFKSLYEGVSVNVSCGEDEYTGATLNVISWVDGPDISNVFINFRDVKDIELHRYKIFPNTENGGTILKEVSK